ncbi:hypothetical protein [Paenibacillus sp. 1P03SA]|uniref:hypothetical protein n=1 Tax=Paenibacillus sp. 1P03SA TaxID=3132294 RepID=UPI0039A0CAE9
MIAMNKTVYGMSESKTIVEFGYGPFAPPLEEQANKQGLTLGEKAEFLERLRESKTTLMFHVLTDSQLKSITHKINKLVVESLKPLNDEIKSPMKKQYNTGSLGHLLENYLEPAQTNIIIYEEAQEENPPKLLFDKDARVHEYLRSRRVKTLYDAEGGGIVIIVNSEL